MKTSDFGEVIEREIAGDPQLSEEIAALTLHLEIAEMIFAARCAAGLTQTQLADRLATSQSVIARLESAGYMGHSIKMLQKISHALGRRLRVTFHDEPRTVESPVANMKEIESFTIRTGPFKTPWIGLTVPQLASQSAGA